MDTAIATEEPVAKTGRKAASASPAILEFSIEKKALSDALGRVTGIVERRNTIPILSNILIDVHEGSISIKATDMDMCAVETASAETKTPGAATTVPAHTIHDIARKLPDDAKIRFVMKHGDRSRLKITSGRSMFQLATLPADDFPDAMTDKALPVKFNIEAEKLSRLFRKTSFAISTEETRYYLNGIYLHPAEVDGAPKLRTVATDGHRLACVDDELPAGAEGFKGVIAPRKVVSQVLKLLDDDSVEVELSETMIRFIIGSLTLTSKLIDGSFPDYMRVIPTTHKKAASVSKDDLVQAVDRVSTLSSEKGRGIKLFFSENTLEVSCNNSETGSSFEEISAEYSFEPLEIGCNARYVLDIASMIDGGIEMKIHDAASPMLIMDSGDPGALFVQMPMRV